MSLLNTQKQQATGVFNVRNDQAQQALIMREKQAEIYFWQELEDLNCDDDYEDHIPIQKSNEKRKVTDLSPQKPSSRERKLNQIENWPSHEEQLKSSACQQATSRYSKKSSKYDRNTSTKKSSRNHDSSSSSDRYAPYPKKHSPRHSSKGHRNHFKDEKVNNSSKSTYNQRN